jgi:hypothetical protein
MGEEKLRALRKIAAELPGQFVEAWRQALAKDGLGTPTDPQIGTVPERVLLEIICTRIFFRHGKRVTENLFASFGPRPKLTEARIRKHTLAALYGDRGKPLVRQFAREAAEHNKKARQLRRAQKGPAAWGRRHPRRKYASICAPDVERQRMPGNY